ncbi:lanosterol synthase [Colletotrichum liriopes]|uniref:Terpene cyclase/mutase family member n=1 Tax=Colletotrichum liriopes TaxID=708192 RepID=A0AA37M0T2_9PEZI|nr:lanosterol synthase [Colletotrichum liriopes]
MVVEKPPSIASSNGTTLGAKSVQSRKRVAEAIAEQEWPKKPRIDAKTDRTRWRMKDEDGRHTWKYLGDDDEAAKSWPQTYADKYYLGLPLVSPPPDVPQPVFVFVANQPRPRRTCRSSPNLRTPRCFMEKLQLPYGDWGCEYGGPMFLLPSAVIAWYVTKTPISSAFATEIKNYLFARAHPELGGWGLHTEGLSTVFGTSLNYTTLRLVGVDAEEPVMVKARARLHELGGASQGPHWSKWWLAVLGVVDWDIVNPIWLLPKWVPIHPERWWVHIRQVFLPMSYVYSRRWSCEETDVIRSLKKELFPENWASIDWKAHRNSIAPGDNYHPKSWLLNTANWFLVNIWNPYLRTNYIKEKAEAWTSELVDMEDANTDYLGLAPVNGPMNHIVCYIRDGPGTYAVRRHSDRIMDSLWVNAEGMLGNGTNGVQCWDTAFMIQSVVAAGLETDDRWRPMLEKALGFLDRQQIREDCKEMEKCYRQERKGGWPFSNREQGYAVSDCISEALKAVIMLQKTEGYPQLLEDRRIFDAVDSILLYQNETGGVGSYERRRGGEYMELLNAAEVFGRIMIEYDYPECTTACVTALSLFQTHWPDYRQDDIRIFIKRAVNWIRSHQNIDGSWYGSWGICFTYAGMFALESLASVGDVYNTSKVSKRGCEFFISKQREDGGWSESYKACETMEYHEHPRGSLVVQTAWALIGLMEAEYPHIEPLRKGIQFLMDRQQANGEWLQETMEGVFNKSCTIAYPNYKFTFPIKALGMFARKYPDEKLTPGISEKGDS